jgi:hypothetical protein
MQTKLTLTIEQEIIQVAKNYAKSKGKSLSEIIENYLKTFANFDKKGNELSPKVNELLGVVSLSEDFDYKKMLSEELIKKHLK